MEKKKYIRWDMLLDDAQLWAQKNHFDDQSSIFVRNLVEQTLARLFERKFEAARWLNDGLIPISTEVDEGASVYGYQEIGEHGEADVMSNDATDFPLADIDGDYTTHRVKMVGTSFRYTTHDVRAAKLQGTFDLVPRKSRAARKVWDKKIDDLLIYGDEVHGFDGLSNAAGIRVDVMTTGGWATATADQILADLTAVFADIENSTDQQLIPNCLGVPTTIMRRLMTTPFNTAVPQITILDYLKAAFPEITKWFGNSKLATAAEDGTAAGMLYNNDPEVVTGQLAMPLRPLPPEQKGATFVVNLESRWGGIMVPQPLGISRLDNM